MSEYEGSLLGTRWRLKQFGVDDLEDSEIEFRSNGKLYDSDSPSSPTYWKISNNTITLNYNNSYSIYTGTVNHNIITGTTVNKVGKKWTFKAEKIIKGQPLVSPSNNNHQKSQNMKELSYNPEIRQFRYRLTNSIPINGVQREFHSYYIHDYYPKNHFGDDVDENIQRIRKLVYKFKDGINSSFVAELISDAIRNLDEDFEDACFIIIPASTQEKTDIRYRSFCTSVCSNIGLINAYNAIVTAPHEATKGTVGGDKTKHFSFDSNLYRDKHVILFDDVRTSGTTFKQVLAKIINSGASNVTGLFLAKTVSYLN